MKLAACGQRTGSGVTPPLAAHRPHRPAGRMARCPAILLTAFLAACAHVTIHEEPDDEALRAAALAGEIAVRLAQLEANFLAAWTGAPDATARAAVLERLRTQLGQALPEPELAAARDYVEAGIDEALPQVSAARDRTRVHLVAITPPPPPPPAVAARIRTVRQRAEAKDLLAYLCVVTEKTATAVFRLWPQSYPPRVAEAAVIGEVRVYRGLYAYRLEPQGGGRVIQCDQRLDAKCARLDLMADDRGIFSCDLALGVCSRREGTTGTPGSRTYESCPNSG